MTAGRFWIDVPLTDVEFIGRGFSGGPGYRPEERPSDRHRRRHREAVEALPRIKEWCRANKVRHDATRLHRNGQINFYAGMHVAMWCPKRGLLDFTVRENGMSPWGRKVARRIKVHNDEQLLFVLANYWLPPPKRDAFSSDDWFVILPNAQ